MSLVPAIASANPSAPTIDGVVGTGEWDGATVINVAGGKGTVSVIARTDYLYVLLNLLDPNDARTSYPFERGNDQVSINVNPTDGGFFGFPYDLIFEMSALSVEDGGHHQWLPWNPKVNSGTIDGWATRWFPDNAQLDLPGDLESATIYSGGNRITEWKIPLATINPAPGSVLKVGGAVDIGDGNSYAYPIDLVWSDASTFVDIVIPYGFNGLLAPYQAPPKAFKIGSSIPLKWQYTDSAGNAVDSAGANPSVEIKPVTDGTTPTEGDPITVNDPGLSGLRYDGLTMTWQFNWQTKGLSAGTYNIYITSGQTGQMNGPFPIQLK